MSADTEQIGVINAGDDVSLTVSVKLAAIIVPIVVVVSGAAASVADGRVGLLAAAVVIGWTQLVGL